MKTFTGILICFLILCSMTSRSQNAPVTIAGNVLDHGPTVVVPVQVTGFVDIGAISLTMDYNLSIVQITGVSPNVNLPGFTADWTTIPGRIVMGWFGSSGVTLPNYSHLVDITFTGLVAGETDLTWIDAGTTCEYAKYDNGAYTTLNDSPTGDYYINGHIKYQPNGPVTIAGNVLSHGPTVVVPITVTGFADIGSISLTLDYNPGIVQITGISANSNLPGFTADWTTIPGRIVMGWFGSSGVTLSDYSHIVDITFSGLVGGETDLTWIDSGISCEYAKYDGGAYNVLNDNPTGEFYINGHIKYQPDGPVTTAGTVLSHGPGLVVPVTVTGFTDIGSLSLTLDYNPAIVLVTGVLANVNLPGFTADWTTIPGRIVMGWFGSSGVSLSDYSHIVDITFGGLNGGETDLTWMDNGISCEYAKYDGGVYTTLYDLPTGDFYINGHIKYQPDGPVTIAGTVLSHGPTVVVPITVTGFTDIGSLSLTLDYNVSIVQITGVTPHVNLPGFTADWTTTPGRIVMGWFGSSGVTLSDYEHIADIEFEGLVGGETDLTWIDNGVSCEYSKYDGGTYTELYDTPTADFYINGKITYQRNGPITVAPAYTSAPDVNLCIPIKVYQFENIGSFSLTLDYDPAVLTFQSVNSSTLPVTWILDGQALVAGRLIVGGLGPGISSLPDGAVLFNACFHYNNCGTTSLAWWDGDGVACEYSDAATLNPLYDLPQSTFYIDGSLKNIPIANPDVNTTNEDVAVSGDAAVNDIPACIGGNVWSLVGPDGGAANGSVTMLANGNYTYTPNPNYNGTDVFKYQVCDANSNCDTAEVTITVNPVDEPDITPSITVEPNVMHGTTNFDITIKVTELNNAPTNGSITVLVPIESRWVLNGAFSNANWIYSSDPTYHIFTSNTIISPSGVSQFVIHATWNAGSSAGSSNVTSQITSGSGGENRVDNDVDAEIIDYFIL